MFFFFNDTATTEIYTLSLHDALPILLAFVKSFIQYLHGHPIPDSEEGRRRLGPRRERPRAQAPAVGAAVPEDPAGAPSALARSEEHTSELQSRQYLVCRLLLEKKKQI